MCCLSPSWISKWSDLGIGEKRHTMTTSRKSEKGPVDGYLIIYRRQRALRETAAVTLM